LESRTSTASPWPRTSTQLAAHWRPAGA
jgi:hypothetical protein